jgi:hypothetical protein
VASQRSRSSKHERERTVLGLKSRGELAAASAMVIVLLFE